MTEAVFRSLTLSLAMAYRQRLDPAQALDQDRVLMRSAAQPRRCCPYRLVAVNACPAITAGSSAVCFARWVVR